MNRRETEYFENKIPDSMAEWCNLRRGNNTEGIRKVLNGLRVWRGLNDIIDGHLRLENALPLMQI